MRYVVLEIQVAQDGTTGTIATTYDNVASAMAKYYQILSVAVQSDVMIHTAVIVNESGGVYRSECIRHEVTEVVEE